MDFKGVSLDSASGHIVVALILVAAGVGLMLRGQHIGEQIVMGSLGSLWTALRVRGGKAED